MLLLVAAGCGVAAAAAPADPVALGGSPLNVFVGERGQLQAFRTDALDAGSPGIFFRSTSTIGDAGFFLAFPDQSGQQASVAGRVFGFDGSAGPHTSGVTDSGLQEYTPVSQGAVSGSGTAADPLKQATAYDVVSSATTIAHVSQTTSYVSGAQEFRIHWDVVNASGAPLPFKALAAADFFFQGDDAGTGIFTQGPPRFIGGTNVDSGSSGGFVEVLGGTSPAWSGYQALAYGPLDDQVWGKIQNAADAATPTFDDTVVSTPVDDAGGIEWDQALTTPLANGATAGYDLVVRSAVPSQLQLNPTNAGSRQGVPISITATALDSNGQPYAGKTLRYAIDGPNAGSGATALDASGAGTVVDPGANAGTDTVTVFVDFNNDGSREAVEPQASALATFVDSVPPTCTIKVSGTLIAGGASGKPLTVTVNCGEGATVVTAATLTGTRPAPRAVAAAARKHKKRKIRIKLPATKTVITPGVATGLKIKIPKAVARKYAGLRLTATVTVTATDQAGNVSKTTTKRKIRLAKIKKAKRKQAN